MLADWVSAIFGSVGMTRTILETGYTRTVLILGHVVIFLLNKALGVRLGYL